MRAGVTADKLPGADEPYFAGIDKGLLAAARPRASPFRPRSRRWPRSPASTPRNPRPGDPRAEHVDRLDGRQRPLLGLGGAHRDRVVRPAQDHLLLQARSTRRPTGARTASAISASSTSPASPPPTGPDPTHFGLWIDQRDPDCAPDPFANAEVPRRQDRRARHRIGPTPGPSSTEDGVLPVGSYYGEPTGVIGLRLFPNPDFDAEAAEPLGPGTVLHRPEYYNRSDLVRPYRVGMSCAFCHVGPNPIDPPDDVRTPMGRADLQSRRAVLLGRPHLLLEHRAPDRAGDAGAERGQLPLPALPHQPARLARHLAGLDRLHEQPAHDERGLRGRRRGSISAARTGRETTARATSSITSSSRTSRRTRRSRRSSTRARARSPRCAC